MRFLDRMSIGTRLATGFSIIVLLIVVLGAIAVLAANEAATVTADLHNHPLAVSNAIRDIRSEMVSMHRSMKDVVLARTDEEVERALMVVASHELTVAKLFEILRDRYLGDPQTTIEAHRLFLEWRPIRQKVVALVAEGRGQDAATITRNEGAHHVNLIDDKLQVMRDFAASKTMEFFAASKASRLRSIRLVSGSVVLISLLALVISVLITRSITVPLNRFVDQVGELSSSDLGKTIELNNEGEIGQLARAFNDMTVNLTATVASRDDLDIANHRLASVNEQLLSNTRELQAASVQAQAASRAKGQFLANMSHEIRTPMNSILGFADLLENRITDIDQRTFVGHIRHSGKSLLRIIDDILDVSRIEAGKMDITINACSLGDIIDEIRRSTKVPDEKSPLTFEIVTSGPLPEYIRTDRGRLQQCLSNVIDNAIKFTDRGYIRLTISVRSVNATSFLCFDVEDTGVGVPRHAHDSIFASFSQADNSSTREFGGVGLGLSITKHLIGLLGGKISFFTEEGCGSTFTIVIPIDASAATVTYSNYGPQGPSSNVLVRDDRDFMITGRILLVEDNPSCRVLTQKVLEPLGVELTIVEDGRQAVEITRKNSFDLILMDMQLPELNGYDATRELIADGVETPIVALTAHAMRGDRLECLEVGCVDYISKPWTKDDLTAVLLKYLPLTTSAVPLS